ncbi:MAG: response regulator [Mariprofundaceae bacterium]
MARSQHQKKSSLLIVEDDAALAAILEEYLSDAAYDVQVLYDGDSALKLLAGETFDLILSDVMLPGASGMAILQKLGGDPARTLVILMTGYSDIDDALSAVEEGAYDYISKPFRLPEVRVRLDNAVAYQRLLRELMDLNANRPSPLKHSKRASGKTAMRVYRGLGGQRSQG